MPAQGRSNLLLIFLVISFVFIAIVTGVFLLNKPSKKLAPSKEPGKTELEGELVAGFPELPVYQGAALVNSYKKQEGEKVGFEANWEIDASVSEVMIWYIDALSESGWVFEEVPEDVDEVFEQSLIAQKDETRVYLTVEREEGAEKTEISAEFPVQ